MEGRPFDLSDDLCVLQVIDEQRCHILFAFGQLVHDDCLSLLERPGDPYALRLPKSEPPGLPADEGAGFVIRCVRDKPARGVRLDNSGQKVDRFSRSRVGGPPLQMAPCRSTRLARTPAGDD